MAESLSELKYQAEASDRYLAIANGAGAPFDSIRAAGRAALTQLRSELGGILDTVEQGAAVLDEGYGLCNDRWPSDEEPSSRPYETLFVVVALVCCATGLLVAWFWLDARR